MQPEPPREQPVPERDLDDVVLGHPAGDEDAGRGAGGAVSDIVRCDPFHVGRVWRDWSFARAACAATAREAFDLVQSHERIACCDVYRAGDGVHRVWLEERMRTGGRLERLRIEDFGQINDAIATGRIRETILVSEALHEHTIAHIAALIADRRALVKLVLIAGPSSSGKTTATCKVSDRLRAAGLDVACLNNPDLKIPILRVHALLESSAHAERAAVPRRSSASAPAGVGMVGCRMGPPLSGSRARRRTAPTKRWRRWQ